MSQAKQNRLLMLALPKREKEATYREIARVNSLDISGGIWKAVEGLIFAPNAKSVEHYAPENTMVIIRAFTRQ